MNATAREMELDLTSAASDETVAYEPNGDSGPDRPVGSSDMPTPTPLPQGKHRYTFGSGARPLDGYTIKRAIGRGGFGEVYYATSDSGKEVALKLILRNLEVERRGVVQCMNLKCPNLLTIYDLKTQRRGRHLRRSWSTSPARAWPTSWRSTPGACPRTRSAPGSRGWSRASPTSTTTASSTAT